MDYGLVMDIGTGRQIELKLEAIHDADYVNDPVDKKSICAYTTMTDGNWVNQLCDELVWEYETPTLFGDNMTSIYMTERSGKHSRVKRIDRSAVAKSADESQCASVLWILNVHTLGVIIFCGSSKGNPTVGCPVATSIRLADR
ncbi:unnamed protein product [Phytophthora fragariaefolia]|uniref:Unnamed protein product n=1 Tax=Phytophthora fragariaefolia TaxID=1490495 RepID=A0A9W6TKL3_9STRA|nr:unnamed protein product [Phytophthora fragariaefolia]